MATPSEKDDRARPETQRRTTSDDVSSRRPSPNSKLKTSRTRDETTSDLRARSMTYSVATQYTHFKRTADIQAIITHIPPSTALASNHNTLRLKRSAAQEGSNASYGSPALAAELADDEQQQTNLEVCFRAQIQLHHISRSTHAKHIRSETNTNTHNQRWRIF